MMIGEQRLFQEIIRHAFKDAELTSESDETQAAKESAIRFLTENSEYFKFICSLAGVCPDKVRKAYTQRAYKIEEM
jgi:hypothetical protein